jgi:hypothetical protein
LPLYSNLTLRTPTPLLKQSSHHYWKSLSNSNPLSTASNDPRYSIITNLTPNKSPGYDLITGKTLKELPTLGLQYPTQLFNAILLHGYFPAQIILIPKPGMPPHAPFSYRLISLLPIVSEVFEKLLLNRLLPVVEHGKLLPTHQFGF